MKTLDQDWSDREVKKSSLAHKESHRLVLEIARLLNGLTVMEARSVLTCTRDLVEAATELDIDSPEFQRHVGAYNNVFNDDISIQSNLRPSQ